MLRCRCSIAVALNAEKEKYFNYERGANGNTIGYVSVIAVNMRE